jgi:uncharacterized membrane protein
MKATVILLLLLVSGCLLGARQNIKVNSRVTPAKVALEEPEPISIEVHVSNVGSSSETITADVTETEGLMVTKPNRTVFTLKRGESRTITFTAYLMEDAVPGEYIIDVKIEAESGEIVWDRAKITVVQEKGLL